MINANKLMILGGFALLFALSRSQSLAPAYSLPASSSRYGPGKEQPEQCKGTLTFASEDSDGYPKTCRFDFSVRGIVSYKSPELAYYRSTWNGGPKRGPEGGIIACGISTREMKGMVRIEVSRPQVSTVISEGRDKTNAVLADAEIRIAGYDGEFVPTIFPLEIFPDTKIEKLTDGERLPSGIEDLSEGCEVEIKGSGLASLLTAKTALNKGRNDFKPHCVYQSDPSLERFRGTELLVSSVSIIGRKTDNERARE